MTIAIATAQYPITYFQSLEAWQAHCLQWLNDAQGAELVLFPEYGSMELASLLPAQVQADLSAQITQMQAFLPAFLETFSHLAQSHACIIVAPSFPVQDNNIFVNRTFVFGPQGPMGFQDKYFMTRFEAETWGISRGKPETVVFDAPWGKFGIQTCYDIEFPIGAYELCQKGASVILVPSCTETIRGATRVHVGARARALENQCWVVVSQTVGDAPWSPAVDINYGYAAVYGTPDEGFPEQGILAIHEAQATGYLHAQLDLDLVQQVRQSGQVFNFKDQALTQYKRT